MTLLAVVDASALYAAANQNDQDHDRTVEVLSRGDLHLVVPATAICEATYMVGTRLGSLAEAAFLRGLASVEIEGPTDRDLERMAELVETYADFPLGGSDAAVIALAERVGTEVVISLDRRHFAAVKPKHCPALNLLPG